MPQSQYFAESGIGYWKNLLYRCHNLNISQNPASKIEEIAYIDATILIFRRIRHRILKKSLKSMPQSQYFAESGIGYWRNLLYRCTNLNISQNPASKIEKIFCIDADDHLNKILPKIIINGIEKSGQVRFKLPESLNLWGARYALHARCSLLQQTYPSLLPDYFQCLFCTSFWSESIWTFSEISFEYRFYGYRLMCPSFVGHAPIKQKKYLNLSV